MPLNYERKSPSAASGQSPSMRRHFLQKCRRARTCPSFLAKGHAALRLFGRISRPHYACACYQPFASLIAPLPTNNKVVCGEKEEQPNEPNGDFFAKHKKSPQAKGGLRRRRSARFFRPAPCLHVTERVFFTTPFFICHCYRKFMILNQYYYTLLTFISQIDIIYIMIFLF